MKPQVYPHKNGVDGRTLFDFLLDAPPKLSKMCACGVIVICSFGESEPQRISVSNFPTLKGSG